MPLRRHHCLRGPYPIQKVHLVGSIPRPKRSSSDRTFPNSTYVRFRQRFRPPDATRVPCDLLHPSAHLGLTVYLASSNCRQRFASSLACRSFHSSPASYPYANSLRLQSLNASSYDSCYTPSSIWPYFQPREQPAIKRHFPLSVTCILLGCSPRIPGTYGARYKRPFRSPFKTIVYLVILYLRSGCVR